VLATFALVFIFLGGGGGAGGALTSAFFG
jgi:hypothetical protein